jgi:hypothetical protein
MYVQAAANFGFRIDKNVPWRLIADLKSKPMEKYRLKYNISSLSGMFGGYYTSIDTYDILATSSLLFFGYQKYQRQRQFKYKTWHCLKPEFRFKAAIIADVITKSKRINFEELSSQDYFAKYINIKFLRLLERIKNIENRGKNLPNYNIFKKKFEQELRFFPPGAGIFSARDAIDLLYNYYNPTKIYSSDNLQIPHYFIEESPKKQLKVLTYKQNLSTMYKTQIGIPGPQNLNLTTI